MESVFKVFAACVLCVLLVWGCVYYETHRDAYWTRDCVMSHTEVYYTSVPTYDSRGNYNGTSMQPNYETVCDAYGPPRCVVPKYAKVRECPRMAAW